MKTFILGGLFLLALIPVSAQNTATDGDWKSRYVKLHNTTEADWMIRQGDIDNLGFGWPKNYSPFSGKETPAHQYPWDQDSTELYGHDMILLGTGQGTKELPCGSDGYSYQIDALKQKYGRTNCTFTIPMGLPKETAITSASIMMFVDDFQSPVFCSKFEVMLNGRRAPFMEKTINALNQTGPIGKFITMRVPTDFLDSLKSDTLKILIDDPNTGAGDGFAIDFIKIAVNTKAGQFKKGILKGVVTDEATGNPVAGATVTLSDGTTVTTNAKGEFTVPSATAGLAVMSITSKNFPEQSFSADVFEGETSTVTIQLKKTLDGK